MSDVFATTGKYMELELQFFRRGNNFAENFIIFTPEIHNVREPKVYKTTLQRLD